MRHFLRVRTCTVLDLVLVLVLVLVLTADEASAQRSVHVSEGADAVLPCTYPGGPPPSDVSIYWKDKHDNQVLTIQNDKMDPRNQSPGYRNRTQSFPHQYKDGNFSLVLMKVDGSDAGLFECHIIPEGFQQNVILNVTSKRGSPESGSSGSGVGSSGPGVGSSGPGVGSSGPSGGSSVASPHLLLHLPLLLLLCL